jgi:UDP-N-acetylmuramoyl-tripeptide--D-alanyl-D-alanine ligase
MATPIPANRSAFTAREIAAAVGATEAHDAGLHTVGVSIDSRSITAGALFVALRAARDGHEFIEAAARAGASAAIVRRGHATGALPCFEVDDTLIALGALARVHLERMRRASHLPVIAIGGAAGKTTTKELTAAVMRALCGNVLATPGNLNNLIGVPMTIFTLDTTHRAAVLECGTNQRGEIPRLARIVQPDAALVLNVDLEHTEGLGSLIGVADEEAALFATGRTAVVATSEALLLERIPASRSRLTFGLEGHADVRLVKRHLTATGSQQITLALNPALVAPGADPRLELTLKLLGATSALNAAAAVAAGAATLARPLSGAELSAIAHALAQVVAVEGRLRIIERGGIVVIDDSYNSNPRSLRSALVTAREVADGRGARLIVALGDMLELGELSAEAHREALRDIDAARPAAVILTGPELAAALSKISAAERPPQLVTAADSVEAARMIADLVSPGDVLLVKGSRGIAMERVIEALLR